MATVAQGGVRQNRAGDGGRVVGDGGTGASRSQASTPGVATRYMVWPWLSLSMLFQADGERSPPRLNTRGGTAVINNR